MLCCVREKSSLRSARNLGFRGERRKLLVEERLEINIGDLQDCIFKQICLHLVDFDHTVDLSHEPEAGKETNCA